MSDAMPNIYGELVDDLTGAFCADCIFRIKVIKWLSPIPDQNFLIMQKLIWEILKLGLS